MSDCLVTKLKASVANDNLEKLGVLVIDRKYNSSETQDTAYIGIERNAIPSGKKVTLTIVGDGYFSESYGGASIGKTVEITSNESTATKGLFTSNGNYKIEVDNKYDFQIAMASADYKINIADLYYTKVITINGAGYFGDLGSLNPATIVIIRLRSHNLGNITYKDADIEKLVNVTSFSIEDENFPEVSLASLGHLKKLTGTMSLNPAKGSIEDFVAQQRLAGRTSFDGTLNLKWIGAKGKVTFQGQTISNAENNTITWTATTISFRGGDPVTA